MSTIDIRKIGWYFFVCLRFSLLYYFRDLIINAISVKEKGPVSMEMALGSSCGN